MLATARWSRMRTTNLHSPPSKATSRIFRHLAYSLLTSFVDTNSNTTSFAYADRNSDGIANELVSVTLLTLFSLTHFSLKCSLTGKQLRTE